MDQGIAERLGEVRARIATAAQRFDPPGRKVTLIAVSKGFGEDHIRAALDAGQRDFGENRVQEAGKKWPALKRDYPDVRLHLIGPLQTNKAREAVALFDVIHTVDREKIAAALAAETARANRRLPIFVEVNIGAEARKAGVAAGEAVGFVERCRKVHGLEVLGLMCIPPAGEAPGPYFAQLALLAKAARVESLSMGMSADYPVAVEMGASHVRIGSAIFGAREA